MVMWDDLLPRYCRSAHNIVRSLPVPKGFQRDSAFRHFAHNRAQTGTVVFAMKRRGEDASLPGCSAGRHARWHSSARARQPAMPRKRADMLISAAMRGASRAENPKRGRADPSISAAVRDATRAASARVELGRVPVEPQRVWREHVTAATAKKCVCNAHACVVRCGA